MTAVTPLRRTLNKTFGIAVVVSPLITLMKDQTDKLESILALTASATPDVQRDISAQLVMREPYLRAAHRQSEDEGRTTTSGGKPIVAS